MFRHHFISNGFQPASGAIPKNGVSDLATDRKANARIIGVGLSGGPGTDLKDQSRGDPFTPGGGDPKKFGTSFKALDGRHRTCALKQKGACALLPDDLRERDGRQRSPCGCGSRADACEQACSVDKYVSRKFSDIELVRVYTGSLGRSQRRYWAFMSLTNDSFRGAITLNHV